MVYPQGTSWMSSTWEHLIFKRKFLGGGGEIMNKNSTGVEFRHLWGDVWGSL